MLLRMLSACAPGTGHLINPIVRSGQDQDPSNETIAVLHLQRHGISNADCLYTYYDNARQKRNLSASTLTAGLRIGAAATEQQTCLPGITSTMVLSEKVSITEHPHKAPNLEDFVTMAVGQQNMGLLAKKFSNCMVNILQTNHPLNGYQDAKIRRCICIRLL